MIIESLSFHNTTSYMNYFQLKGLQDFLFIHSVYIIHFYKATQLLICHVSGKSIRINRKQEDMKRIFFQGFSVTIQKTVGERNSKERETGTQKKFSSVT